MKLLNSPYRCVWRCIIRRQTVLKEGRTYATLRSGVGVERINILGIRNRPSSETVQYCYSWGICSETEGRIFQLCIEMFSELQVTFKYLISGGNYMQACTFKGTRNPKRGPWKRCSFFVLCAVFLFWMVQLNGKRSLRRVITQRKPQKTGLDVWCTRF